MGLPKDIYKQAKDFFKKEIDSVNKPFEDYGQILGSNENKIDDPVNYFAITCLRLLTLDNTDPIDNPDKFSQLALATRTNSFNQVIGNSSIDIGTGKGNSNNLLYKLASDFLKDAKIETKSSVIQTASANPAFQELLKSVSISDKRTYEAITRQAFFNWHYGEYVSGKTIERQFGGNQFRQTLLDLQKINVSSGEKQVRISIDGSPFNAGYPVVCVVFEADLVFEADQIINQQDIIEEAGKFVFPLFGRIIPESYDDYLVKVFTHKKEEKDHSKLSFIKTENGSYKVCVGFDYANLITLQKAKEIDLGEIQNFEVKLGESKNVRIKTFMAINGQSTDSVIRKQIEDTTIKLMEKNDAVQNGPALFFDLQKEAEIGDIKDKAEKYEFIEFINESITNATLKRQYSLNLENAGQNLDDVYKNNILEKFISARFSDPRSTLYDLDPEQILEDVIFYYDEFDNLLAVGVSPKKNTKVNPSITLKRTKQNQVPFEFGEQSQPISSLDSYYSIIPVLNYSSPTSLINNRLPGFLVLVTDFYFDKFNVESPGLPVQIKFNDLKTSIVGTNQIFATVLLKTINEFFYQSNSILKAEDEGIQVFLKNFHYPKLIFKPSVPKQKDTGEDDSGLVKPKIQNAPATKEDKKKIYDVADYNSYSKSLSKQVFVNVAQVSNSPCLQDLANVVRDGSLDQIYLTLLTKFPWDEILAKSLLTRLRQVSNLVGSEEAKAFANQVNACLADANIDKLLAAFANLKEAFLNLDKIIQASLPEIPKLNQLIPYIYVLDFQKVYRDLLAKAIEEAIKKALQFILGIMLEDILARCQEDASLQTLLYDKLGDPLGFLDSFEDKINKAAFEKPTSDELGLEKVYVNLNNLIIASRIDNINNVYQGLLDLFPIMDETIKASGRNKNSAMEEILNGLSVSIPAEDTKVLLNGTALDLSYNKVIAYSKTNNFIKTSLKNKFNVGIFYDYLSKFIKIQIINNKIAQVTRIIPDPCFVNFGSLGIQDLEILGDLDVDSLVNNAADEINSICSRLSESLLNFSIELPSLISDSSKKSLQKAVDNSTQPIIQNQQIIKDSLLNKVDENIKKISTTYTSYGLPQQDQKSTDSTLFQALKTGLNQISSKDKFDYIYESFNTNFFDGGFKIYGDQNTNSKTPFSPTIDSIVNVPPDSYFSFLLFELFGATVLTKEEIVETFNLLKDSELFKTKIEQIFNTKSLIERYNNVFNNVINEGGKNANLFASNMKEMKKIINETKGK